MAKPVVISLFWLNAPVATLAGYHFDTSLPPAACNVSLFISIFFFEKEKASARPTFIGSLFELVFESCACFDQDEVKNEVKNEVKKNSLTSITNPDHIILIFCIA